MARRHVRFEPCTGHGCPCQDEDRPGWPCSECGEEAVLWLSEEDFEEMERLDPIFAEA